MKYLVNKVLKPFILLSLVSLLIEIIFKIVLNLNLWDWSMLRIILGIIVINGVLALVASFLPKKGINILIILASLVKTLYALNQAGFYNYLGTYMSFSTSSQAKAIGSFVMDFIKSFKPLYWCLTIPFLLLLIYYLTIDRMVRIHETNLNVDYLDKINSEKDLTDLQRNEKKAKYKSLIIAQVFIIGSVIIAGLAYYESLTINFMQNELQMMSTAALFKNPSLPNIAVSQFGIEGFGIIDTKAILFPCTDDTVMALGSVSETTTDDVADDLVRTVDDTLWENAINNETNDDYLALDKYFISKEVTPKNDQTGIFAGKNLIIIMMESGSNVITDYPEYFPNINKLYNEGWSFDNAFSPRNACSTGNNEMSGLTSLYTINRSCTANVYKDNTYYEALFNLFNEQNYYTSSYHDYTDHFYYRHIYHPNMGSQNFYGVTDLGMTLGSGYQPWPSDVDFIDAALPHFINQDKYMSWLTTVSSHMSYTASSVTGDMYLDNFKNETWSTAAKRYMSKLKILDNAIGELINKLTASGKLDDTVIMLFADHYPYGLATKDFASLAKYDVTSNADIDRTPFIIYNSQLTPTKYDQYTSYMNILPTIANLFDLDYDPRLYGGYDLFSSDYPNIVVFADGSWRSDIAYYEVTTGKITYLGDETYTNDQIIAINNQIKNEMTMDNLAIKTNYFNYLGNILNKQIIVNTTSQHVEEEVVEDLAD
jgi:phosphoglycerol transferase MdoB-like AlkP superfamily enzyme